MPFRHLVVALASWLAAASVAAAARLDLREGDHVCIIGGGVAEAMQHTGWLEVYLHSRFPAHRLVIRNLGFEGDEVRPGSRMRSADFGTPDQWLSGTAPVPRPGGVKNPAAIRQNRFETVGTRADVVLAFFGSNEAHAGPAGLGSFKQDVAEFITHTLGQRYNGVSAPRLVMVSPIAHEDLGRPHWPDGRDHNAHLAIYTRAMEDVCAANGVECIDLFTPTLEAYAKLAEPLTHDGIHPNSRGDREISRIIDESLFGPHPARDPRSLDRLQRAVADKNACWFNRYRVTDGYSTYGGRAWLEFVDGQTNYEVGQRELEFLDAKTANRDRRIWATAATLADPAAPLPQVDDVDLPAFLAVATNRPGPLPDGKHAFLTGEDAIGKMTVHSGMTVGLFADEAGFPELINPVQMAFDTRGRLWVATWPTYPHCRPDEVPDDKLLILEDRDGDGRADLAKTFAGDLHNPTGFEFWGRGVIVAQGPDVLYLEDADGDDRADVATRIIRGLDTADTHHAANSFTLDPSGGLYFQEGTFHHSQPESPWGPPIRVANGAVFRYEPRTGRIGLYTSYAFANPHGHAFDRWGNDIVVDGTMAAPFWGSVFSTRLDGLDKHTDAPTVYRQRTRPCSGIEFLSSPHFPAEMQGNLLVGNVIGFQGILQYAFTTHEMAEASFPQAVEIEPIVSSSDPNFRPADIEMGPDGAIYFCDWHNPVIGHMQHNLRDPSRDRAHGRVYRVAMHGRPPAVPVPISGRSVPEVVRLLEDPTDRVRYRARLELSGRPEAEVVPAVKEWLSGLDAAAPEHEHHRLEALWVLRSFEHLDLPLLEAVLTSADPRARAAGMRVLATIVDGGPGAAASRVPAAIDLVCRGAGDESPRVRLEALRTASCLRQPEAVEALAIAEAWPSDRQMDYVRKESARVLDPQLRRARAAGMPVALRTEAGRRYVLRSLDNQELAREPRSPDVCRELLLRSGIEPRLRREAVEAVAEADRTTTVQVVADTLHLLDRRGGPIDSAAMIELIRLLSDRPREEISGLRNHLERLATSSRQAVMRRIGFVALTAIDAAEGGDPIAGAWRLAGDDPARLLDLVESLPMVEDPGTRASLSERIVGLIDGSGLDAGRPGRPGRFVRVQMFGSMRKPMLAEVEAFSGNENVARGGTASQKQTEGGADAARGIDGRTDRSTGAVPLDLATEDPWWEVDLGGERPLTRIVVHCQEGVRRERLKTFTLTVLDDQRREIFKADGKADPSSVIDFPLASDREKLVISVRRAAMLAMAGMHGRESEAFRKLAAFVQDPVYRDAATRALTAIPAGKWPPEEAASLLDTLVASIKGASAEERSSDPGLAAWQFAENLTTLLPAERGRAVRAVLADLGVRVVKIGTVEERMAYDRETVAVQAGRPVLFVLENADVMPHNFVITRPGTMQKVGELAEASAQNPAFALRNFVPATDDVLAASGLMKPRESQRLLFDAPTEPGVYPYVCTYPGHWRRMFGALYVVDDLEAYLADPGGFLAAHPLRISDPLLEDRRPRTAWTLADLEAGLTGLEKGRSFLHGRTLFRTASCVSCHAMGGAGNALGPDLARLDATMTPLEIARHVLEPSLRVEERYRATTIVTDDGRSVSGLVVEETPTEIAIVENPAVKADPMRISKDSIDDRIVSPVSIMPKGLLDTLTRDEVLDLIAYVASKGDASNTLFSPDGCPHHDAK